MAVLFNDSLVLSNCIPWIQLAGVGEDEDCTAAGTEGKPKCQGGEAVGGSCALVFEGGLVQCDTVEMFGFSGKQLSRTFRGYG